MGFAVRVWLSMFVALVAASLAVLPATASPAGSDNLDRLAPLEQSILAKVNQVRAARGLRSLTLSSELESAAVDHSQSMLTYGFFRHESKDGSPFEARLRRFYPLEGFSRWQVGENLVYSSVQLNATGAVRAWLRSPPHREDMLSPGWREVGVGALHADAAGGTFKQAQVWVVTIDFGARSRSYSNARAAVGAAA
jgi:uncharacterized protein YkwD